MATLNQYASMTRQWFSGESTAGILLMAAALLAMVAANTPLLQWYTLLLDTPVEVRVGALHIAKPLLLWINDGLMAVFFFIVGLELKRELLEGGLADRRNIILPCAGAMGGMALPACIYLAFNHRDPMAINGWAIPTATDIAFALGVLSLLGSRVPVALKVFLTSLAIFDDIGAIVIIAIFYTAKISAMALMVAAAAIVLLWLLNRLRVSSKGVYILIGVVMWTALLKSGVHATLAGVILAMFIPMRDAAVPERSPVRELEHNLHATVTFFVLPLFAFANAGLNLAGVGSEQLLHSVPVGIALGLLLGKLFGVFSFCWLTIRLRLASLPDGVSWLTLFGISSLCGIGFTMSLFIGSLAFEQSDISMMVFDDRLGILIGSVLSGIMGYAILRRSLSPRITA